MSYSIPITKSQSHRSLPPSADLRFGQHFTDHWLHAEYSAGEWRNARVEPYGALMLNPAASVLHYGQALFEGMKAFRQANGQIALFRPEYNWQRICAGAERLCMVAPPRDLFMKGLRALIEVDARWVPADDTASLYIRPTLIGSEGFLGVRPSNEQIFFVILSPVGSYFSTSAPALRIWVEDQAVRAVPGGLGATKAGANYAASLKTALQAKQKKYDQVLWLDAAHEGIEEVGTMNVFFVFQDEVVTPALNGSILAGGMRDSVLTLLRRTNRPVVERRLTIQELKDRHAQGDLVEAFGTGTAAVISPIGEFCYRGDILKLEGSRQLSERLFAEINAIQYGRGVDPDGWMVPLNEL